MVEQTPVLTYSSMRNEWILPLLLKTKSIICILCQEKNHQLGKYNRLEYVSELADSVCLYFHDPSMYSPEKVLKGFEQFKLSTYVDKKTGELKHHTIRIKHIYCVINEGEGVVEVFDVE